MKRSMMKKFMIGLFCTLLSLPAIAQEDELKDLPGYVEFGDLSSMYGEPKIIINLGGTMLNFVGMMSSQESPETSELISKLKRRMKTLVRPRVSLLRLKASSSLLAGSQLFRSMKTMSRS